MPLLRHLWRQHARRPGSSPATWEEDPGCYLTDAEIGAGISRPRLTVTAYHRPRRNITKETMP